MASDPRKAATAPPPRPRAAARTSMRYYVIGADSEDSFNTLAEAQTHQRRLGPGHRIEARRE